MSDCRDTHHLRVCATVESFSENSHHKDIDEERDEQRDGRLYEEIFVGLLDVLLVRPIHLTRLKRTFGHVLMSRCSRTVSCRWLENGNDATVQWFIAPWREQSGGRCCEAWWRLPRCRRPESSEPARSPRSTARTSPSAAGPDPDSLSHTEREEGREKMCKLKKSLCRLLLCVNEEECGYTT